MKKYLFILLLAAIIFVSGCTQLEGIIGGDKKTDSSDKVIVARVQITDAYKFIPKTCQKKSTTEKADIRLVATGQYNRPDCPSVTVFRLTSGSDTSADEIKIPTSFLAGTKVNLRDSNGDIIVETTVQDGWIRATFDEDTGHPDGFTIPAGDTILILEIPEPPAGEFEFGALTLSKGGTPISESAPGALPKTTVETIGAGDLVATRSPCYTKEEKDEEIRQKAETIRQQGKNSKGTYGNPPYDGHTPEYVAGVLWETSAIHPKKPCNPTQGGDYVELAEFDITTGDTPVTIDSIRFKIDSLAGSNNENDDESYRQDWEQAKAGGDDRFKTLVEYADYIRRTGRIDPEYFDWIYLQIDGQQVAKTRPGPDQTIDSNGNMYIPIVGGYELTLTNVGYNVYVTAVDNTNEDKDVDISLVGIDTSNDVKTHGLDGITAKYVYNNWLNTELPKDEDDSDEYIYIDFDIGAGPSTVKIRLTTSEDIYSPTNDQVDRHHVKFTGLSMGMDYRYRTCDDEELEREKDNLDNAMNIIWTFGDDGASNDDEPTIPTTATAGISRTGSACVAEGHRVSCNCWSFLPDYVPPTGGDTTGGGGSTGDTSTGGTTGGTGDTTPGTGDTTGSGTGGDTSSTSCTSSDYTCTAWSECANNQQTRTCTKKATSSCVGGTSPATTQSCTPACNEEWACGAWSDWSMCPNAQMKTTRTRTCTDPNPATANCPAGTPPETEEEPCTPFKDSYHGSISGSTTSYASGGQKSVGQTISGAGPYYAPMVPGKKYRINFDISGSGSAYWDVAPNYACSGFSWDGSDQSTYTTFTAGNCGTLKPGENYHMGIKWTVTVGSPTLTATMIEI